MHIAFKKGGDYLTMLRDYIRISMV